MASAAPDYIYYAEEFGGNLSEAQFLDNVHGAEDFVLWNIGFNAIGPEHADAVKDAICEAVDVFAEYGGDGAASFTIGGFSMSATDRTGRQVAADRILRHLFPTGLLYRGV